jgi:hypothetical protein
MSEKDVLIRLTNAQALVLFEWLASLDEAEPIDATQIVLWKIEGQLESTLVELFAPNYGELLERARANVISNAID